MENSTDNTIKVNTEDSLLNYMERECEICHDSFYSYGEVTCEKCGYKNDLIKMGYTESYADNILKTHFLYEQQMRDLLHFNIPSEIWSIIPKALSILVKCHCNAHETGWYEGHNFAMEQPRELSSHIDIPDPITPKADEVRKESRIVVCDRCEGTGKVRVYNEDPGYMGPGEEQCPICLGKGRRQLIIQFMFSPIPWKGKAPADH